MKTGENYVIDHKILMLEIFRTYGLTSVERYDYNERVIIIKKFSNCTSKMSSSSIKKDKTGNGYLITLDGFRVQGQQNHIKHGYMVYIDRKST